MIKYTNDSREHKDRLSGIVNMLINTGDYFVYVSNYDTIHIAFVSYYNFSDNTEPWCLTDWIDAVLHLLITISAVGVQLYCLLFVDVHYSQYYT